MRRILDFCGLEFEPACVEFHKTARSVRTASSEQVRLPLYREGLDQWKNFEPWLEPLKAALGDAPEPLPNEQGAHETGSKRSMPLRQRQQIQALLRAGDARCRTLAGTRCAIAVATILARSSRCSTGPFEGGGTQSGNACSSSHPRAGVLWKILGVSPSCARERMRYPRCAERPSLMPQDGEAHGNLGAALHDQGQWAEALVSLRRALEIQPHNVQALVDAGDAMRALGQAREAVSLYRRALSHECPDWPRPKIISGTRFWSSADMTTPSHVTGWRSRSSLTHRSNATWATPRGTRDSGRGDCQQPAGDRARPRLEHGAQQPRSGLCGTWGTRGSHCELSAGANA